MSEKVRGLLLGLVLAGLALATAGHTASISITARPKFEQKEQFTYLILGEGSRRHEIGWSYAGRVKFVPASLDTNQIYTFTLAEKRLKTTSIQKLIRIQQKEKTIYDIEVCEVHQTKMALKEVPIVYGLIIPSVNEPPAKAELELFPHRREWYSGGCVVRSPKTEEVYVCSRCKEAYENWKRDHQKK